MTSKERMLVAMKGGIADRVPASPDTNWTIPARLKGKKFWDIYYYNDPPIWKAYNDCVKYYGLDGFSHHGVYSIPPHPDTEEIKEVIHKDEEKMIVKSTFRCPAGTLTQEETFLVYEPPTPTKKIITDFVGQYEALKYYFFGQVDKINFDE